LVSLCLICHTCVLTGNLQTAGGLYGIGQSTNGWSRMGLGLAESLHNVEYIMGNVSVGLTLAIAEISAVQGTIDNMLASTGAAADASLLSTRNQSPRSLLSRSDLHMLASTTTTPAPNVTGQVSQGMDVVSAGLDKFITAIEPALLQVGEWYETFGPKIQDSITQFSTTIDMVEKMFDQIMGSINGPGDNLDYMVQNTFTLFAVSSSGDIDQAGITVKDLQDVSQIYQITALQGSKSEELYAKYDTDKDAALTKSEFEELVKDATIPGAMSMVLRQYAKKLSQVAGTVKAARLRDEVASSIVEYFQLVCAKNMTKVHWVSEALTNKSLPLEFTADIMKNLAMAGDDPDVLTSQDVGATVVGVMASLNPEQTTAAAKLMADAKFWVSEGFDPADQAKAVEKVTSWTSASLLQTGSVNALSHLRTTFGAQHDPTKISLLSLGDTDALIRDTVSLASRTAQRSMMQYQYERRASLVERRERLRESKTARLLFDNLLGGAFAFTGDPKADQAVNSGVPAKPETLLFASYLASNASQVSQEFQHACFTYSGVSSSALEAFATQIEGLIKKTQGFMNLMGQYQGEQGVAKLRSQVEQFVANGAGDIIGTVKNNSNSAALIQVDQPAYSGAVQQLSNTLTTVQSALPPSISNLKLAKKQVSSVAATLNSIFSVFEERGLPLFKQATTAYKTLWVVYFILLVLFTLGILYYGFWASGYCGGPKKTEDVAEEDHPAPIGFKEKCCVCWRSCCHCLSETSGTDCCFWSCLLLMELLVLLIFLISVVLCLLAGVKVFINSGCGAIFILADEPICTNSMFLLQLWLNTFDAGSPSVPIFEVCEKNHLMLCKIIHGRLHSSVTLTTLFSLLAAILSFQLLVDSAILHERARWHKMIEDEKEKQGAAPGSAAAPSSQP